ncbi:MAG TPA: hypothetical protein PK685_02905 [archaeon]|nr:hypothetical protein [archaeon]
MKLVDSSCLICLFGEINKPFVLLDWKRNGHRIVITDQVNDEIICGDCYNKIVSEIKNGNIEVEHLISSQEVDKLRYRYLRLGKGECSIILAALKYNQKKEKYYAILDDKDARKIAKEMGVNLTGTVGLLLKLKEKNCISEETYTDCVTQMKNSKFRFNWEQLE